MDVSQTMDEALEILAKSPLIDGHNDWPHLIRGFYDNAIENPRFAASSDLVGQVDIGRLVKSRAGGVFWSAYVDCPSRDDDFRDEIHLETIRDTLQQIDLIHRLLEKYDHVLEAAHSSQDILPIFRSGKVACLLGIEGLHQIGNSASVLRMYHRLGVRYVTLTHNQNNLYADSATSKAKVHGGLSQAGHDMVKEINRIGIMIDLSHASDAAARAVLEISVAPALFTHSSANAICASPRNVTDETLDKIQQNRGIVMVSFIPELTHKDAAQADVYGVVEHIIYMANRIGFEHVGIGTDFDGMAKSVDGLEDVSKFPVLVAAMLARGIKRQDIENVLGLNVIRVLQEVEKIARDQKGELPILEDSVKQLWSDDIRKWVRSVYPHAA